MTVQPLRPLGVGEIIGRGFGVYRTHFAPIAAVGVAFAVPIYVVIAGINIVVVGDGTLDPGEAATTILAATAVVWVLQLAATTLSNAAAFRLVASEALGQPGDIGASVQFAVRRFLPLVGLTLLQGILTILLALCCVIPGVVFAIGTYVATGVLLFEGAGPADSLNRAWELVKPRFWSVFGVLLLQGIVTFGFAIVLLGVVVAVGGIDATSATYQVLNVVVQVAVVALTLPFTAGVAVWMYLDLRHRAEGYTLRQFGAAVDLQADFGPYAQPYEGGGAPGAMGQPGPPPGAGWPPPPVPLSPEAPPNDPLQPPGSTPWAAPDDGPPQPPPSPPGWPPPTP